jgi:hypothetical protein
MPRQKNHFSDEVRAGIKTTDLPKTVAATAAGVMGVSLQEEAGSMAAWSTTTLFVDTSEFIMGSAMGQTEKCEEDLMEDVTISRISNAYSLRRGRRLPSKLEVKELQIVIVIVM